jgi:hypothetical protein
MMRTRSVAYAIGSAGNEEAGFDIIDTSRRIDYQYAIYRLSSIYISVVNK